MSKRLARDPSCNSNQGRLYAPRQSRLLSQHRPFGIDPGKVVSTTNCPASEARLERQLLLPRFTRPDLPSMNDVSGTAVLDTASDSAQPIRTGEPDTNLIRAFRVSLHHILTRLSLITVTSDYVRKILRTRSIVVTDPHQGR